MSHQYDWEIPELNWGTGIKHDFKIFKNDKYYRTDSFELSENLENKKDESELKDYLNHYFEYNKFFKKGFSIKVFRGNTEVMEIVEGHVKKRNTKMD